MAKKNVAVGVGVVGLLAGSILLATRKVKAVEPPAPPPIPPPGLANLFGKVTDAITGKEIIGVLVTIDGLETITNSAGNYAFTDLEPGGYVLQFSKDGYETAVF